MFAQFESVRANFLPNIGQILSVTRVYDFVPDIIDEVPTREYYLGFGIRILKRLLTGTDEG
jgi:hypothetical protein